MGVKEKMFDIKLIGRLDFILVKIEEWKKKDPRTRAVATVQT